MQTATLKTNAYSKMNRTVIDSLLSFNLLRLFEKVKLKRTWMNGELDSKILVNRTDKQIVLTTIHEDTEIDSYQSNDSVTFQVIAGVLKYHSLEESIILVEGQSFTLCKHIHYSLTTEKETMFLLIIAGEITTDYSCVSSVL